MKMLRAERKADVRKTRGTGREEESGGANNEARNGTAEGKG